MVETYPSPNTAYEPPDEEVTLGKEIATAAGLKEHEKFVYEGDKFFRVDEDADIFEQLKEVAKKGDEGLVGLEWLEKDGLRYRVSSYEKLTRVRNEVSKTFLPRFFMRNGIQGGPAIERKEIYTPATETVDQRTVDVINSDGDIIDVLTFTGSERRWIQRYSTVGSQTNFYGRQIRPRKYEEYDRFKQHFYVSPRDNHNAPYHGMPVPRRSIIGMRWSEPSEPEINGKTRINAPEIEDWSKEKRFKPQKPEDFFPMKPEGKIEELFKALALQQEELGLASWQGLTWNSPFVKRDKWGRWNRRDINQMQIIRDEVVIRKDPLSAEDYPERVFEVRFRSPNGTTFQRHIYTMDKLKKHFILREKRDREAKQAVDLPREIVWPILVGLYERHGELYEHHDPKDHVDHGPDWNLHWEIPESSRDNKQSKEAVTGNGVSHAYKIYEDSLRWLGIKNTKEEREEIQDKMEQGLSGEDGVDVEHQSRLINFYIGYSIKQAAIKDVKKRIPGWDPKDPDKQIEKTVHIYAENSQVTSRLRPLLYQEAILNLLRRKKNSEDDEPEISSSELEDIGHWVRLSFGKY